MITSKLEEIRHREKCFLSSIIDTKSFTITSGHNDDDKCDNLTSNEPSSSNLPQNPMLQKYECKLCQKIFYLTPTGIVKHIRNHKVD